MSSEGNRVQYVDVIKGIAVIWIVLYHLIAPCGFKTIVTHLSGLFLVSFFYYSGFFYRTGKRSIGQNIGNRSKSVLIPFFRYSLSFWVVGSIYLVATKAETVMEAFLCLRNFYAGCIWNRVIQNWFGWEYYSLGKRYFYLADFWFLLAMLFASSIFFLIVDIALRSAASMIITVAAMFAVTGLFQWQAVLLPYNIQLAPYWAAFMILGAYAGSRKLTELKSLSVSIRCTLAIALLACAIVIAMLTDPSTNQFRGSFGENELLSMFWCILSSVPFTWGIGILFAYIESAGVKMNALAWVGSHSLFLYLFHMFYAWILCIITGFSVRYEETVTVGVLWGSVLLTVVCLILCTLRGIVGDKLKKKKLL